MLSRLFLTDPIVPSDPNEFLASGQRASMKMNFSGSEQFFKTNFYPLDRHLEVH